MFEFKVGMKVRVRPNLEQIYYKNFKGNRDMDACEKMIKMAGQTVTIKFVDEETGTHHRIEEDDSLWSWSDTMFSIPATEEEFFDMLVCGSITEEEYKQYAT